MSIKLEYKEFEIGVNCVLSSVANIISNYDNTVDDSAMLFLENGFNISYSNSTTSATSTIRDIKIESNITKIARIFMQKREIRYEYGYLKIDVDIDQIKSFIFDSIKKGNPIVAAADTTLLDYNMVYASSDRRDHVITITGIDGDDVQFSDCYVPSVPISTYQGVMQVDKFKRTWESTGYKYIDIDYDSIKNKKFNITDEILCNAVKDNLYRYIYDDTKVSSINNLYSFADDVAQFVQRYSEVDIKRNIKELSFKIQYEGILATLFLLKKVLLRLKYEGKHGIDDALLEQLDDISNRWRKVTLMLVKAAFRVSEDSFKNISNFIRVTVEYQEALIKNILQILA